MVKKNKMLVEASLISCIGVIMAILSYIAPMANFIVLVAGVPYAVISYRNGMKNGIMGAIVSLMLISMMADPLYAIFMFTIVYIPSVVMGQFMKDQTNMFEPVSKNFIMALIGVVLYSKVMALIFGINIKESIDLLFEQAFNIQNPYIKSMQPNLTQTDLKRALESFRIILPSFIILQSIVMAFITYFASVFIIKRTNKGKPIDLPSFKNMTLPGNIAFGLLIIYLLSMFVKSSEIISYSAFSTNLVATMVVIFFIQGIAVMDYLLERAKTKTFFRRVLMIGSVIIAQLSIVISILGVVDSIVNIRRMKR